MGEEYGGYLTKSGKVQFLFMVGVGTILVILSVGCLSRELAEQFVVPDMSSSGSHAVQSNGIEQALWVRDLGDSWIETEGQAQVANITPEEAQRRALQEARNRAIEYAVGIDVQHTAVRWQQESEKIYRDAFQQLTTVASAGRIVEERPAEWQQFEIPASPLPITVYRARVQVKVAKEEGKADPGFQVKAELNQEVYREGEEMRLAITATRPCYVTVLNWTAVDTVVVLLPNKYRQARRVEPEDTLWVPDTGEKERGIHYRFFLPTNRQEAAEAIWVIATKEGQVFGQGLPEVETALRGYKLMPTRQGAWVELMRWLVQIPRDQRAEAQVVYEVR